MDYILVVPQRWKDISFVLVASFGSIWTLKKVINTYKYHVAKNKKEKLLEQCSKSPKDVVILHTLPRGKTCPSNSPFALKLETYLRMTNINFEVDFENPFSPDKGKTPWITLNGTLIADSEIIIQFLSRRFKTSVGDSYSDEEKAVAHAVRIMLDEHFYFGLGLWRYVYSGGQGLQEIFDMPPNAIVGFYAATNARIRHNSWAQGIGRHNQEIVLRQMNKNLESASLILGNKKFLLGDEPCEQDCSLFGFIAQVLWCHPGSPYEKFITENLSNLESYAVRMKEIFWPDWNDCLAGARSRSQRLLADAT